MWCHPTVLPALLCVCTVIPKQHSRNRAGQVLMPHLGGGLGGGGGRGLGRGLGGGLGGGGAGLGEGGGGGGIGGPGPTIQVSADQRGTSAEAFTASMAKPTIYCAVVLYAAPPPSSAAGGAGRRGRPQCQVQQGVHGRVAVLRRPLWLAGHQLAAHVCTLRNPAVCSPPSRHVSLCTVGASGLRGGSAMSGVNSAQKRVVSFCHQPPQLAPPGVKSGGRALDVMNSMAGQRTAEAGTSSCTPWKAGRADGLLLRGDGSGQRGDAAVDAWRRAWGWSKLPSLQRAG